ncbi:ankyrin [Mytilinidion resinicola]|uniref:Ankyrin n=1 Tax=Mytilinidion resinicola TaxID=574789 RepID=A0A6A6YNV9_9PEZI|nr:ankyrin [Mytilinidion resinicola]KAF2810562.1 ankyrin [Mytilinidion resinicola]
MPSVQDDQQLICQKATLRTSAVENPAEISAAACKGDLEEVKKQVQRLLHDPRPPEPQPPQPKWLAQSLLIAMQKPNIEMVQFLLDENVADPHSVAEAAVRGRGWEVLELFLQYGWDINRPQGRNEPPLLSIPLCTADREMVEWLLNHGADPNARCAWDFTPMSLAMYLAPLDLIDYVFSRGGDAHYGQLLHCAVLREKPDALDVVRRVIQRGAPINEVKYEKEPMVYWEREPFGLGTALHRAAEFGNKNIVKYLLEQGADPLKLDSKGKTPRFWAEKCNDADVASILKEAEDNQSSARLRL